MRAACCVYEEVLKLYRQKTSCVHEEVLKLYRQKTTHLVENVFIRCVLQLIIMLTIMVAFHQKLPQIVIEDLLFLAHCALCVQSRSTVVLLT